MTLEAQPQPQEEYGICKHGNFTPCGLCASEAQKTRPETKKARAKERAPEKESFEDRMESGTYDTELFEGSFATVSSETHPERNEDSIGVYPEENAVVVFDGMGGHAAGDAASQMARDGFVQKLKEARTMTREDVMTEEEFDARWNEIISGNSLIDHEEASAKTKFKEIRDREIQKARDYFDALNAPDEVKREAAALALALKELSLEIHKAGEADPEKKDMGTTAAGAKIIEFGGRRFAVVFSVGDSEAYLERAKTGAIVRAVKADSGIDHALERDIVTPERAGNLDDPLVRQARFSMVSQNLGQEKPPIPRVMIWELEEGDRLVLASDGLGDLDLRERWKNTLRNRKDEPWDEVSQKMARGAMEGLQNPEEKGKKGGDDITVAILESKPTAAARDWGRLLDEELSKTDLADKSALKSALNAERSEIARAVLAELEGAKNKSDSIVTAALRERIREEIARRTGQLPKAA